MKPTITIVTGLPRSGTTMMMRMIEAGGIPLFYEREKPVTFTDGGVHYINMNRVLRESDKVKDLHKGTDASWLNDCKGKAVKILNPANLTFPDLEYRFIWMDRGVKQMANSRIKYREFSNKFDLRPKTRAELVASICAARKAGLKRLQGSPVLVVKFEDVLAKPKAMAIRVSRFLKQWLNVEAMAKVVVKRKPACLPDLMEERIYG